MNYPLSELVDRYSILILKDERLRKEEIKAELRRFHAAVFDFPDLPDPKKVNRWVSGMVKINGRIWDLEADIRQGKEGKLGLDEVGRRALLIRDINKERIAFKNKIAHHMKEFEEVKVDHGSS